MQLKGTPQHLMNSDQPIAITAAAAAAAVEITCVCVCCTFT